MKGIFMKKSLLKAFVGFAFLAVTAVPAFATNWVQIGEGHYIDAHSIRPSANYGTYTYYTKYLAKAAPLERINGYEVWTIKTNSYVDCANAYAKTLSYTALDANERIVASDKKIGKQWFGVNNPGSKAYESYAFVCTDKYLNVRPGYHPLWWY